MKFLKHSHHKPLSETLPDLSDSSAKQIRRVVKIGCMVNILLMALKLSAGYWGHSDALFADGFHSLNDVAADLIMLFFVGISYRKEDERFNYGYGKFETFSAFLMSSFLIFIAIMIGTEGVESIIDYANGESLPQPDIWTVVVVLFAMACKEGLFRFYSRSGRKAGSKALVANAWHHRSDALASVATLVGVSFSHFFGAAFRILDPVASLVIAIFILIPAIKMISKAFVELMERALPKDEEQKARMAIEDVVGADNVKWMRTRRNGHRYLFEVGIKVAPDASMSDFSKLSNKVKSALQNQFCSHIILSIVPIS